MINEAQKELLKEYLQNDYTRDVIKILKKRNIRAKNGSIYSAEVVRIVFNGNWDNQDIEDAIFDVYKKRKAKARLIAANRKNILSK